MMTLDVDASDLIGRPIKDEVSKEVGKIISFLIDSSGQVEEVLVENKYGRLLKYPVDRLKIGRDEVSLTSYVDSKVEQFSEKFPIINKKRKILDTLSEHKVIPSEIYQNLCKEFDKNLKEMADDAQSLLEDMEKQIKVQEDQIKMLQLARTFLEIEHGIGSIKDEIYQQSLVSILKDIKNASQKRVSLLKTRDRIMGILRGEEVESEKETLKIGAIAEVKAEPEAETQPIGSEEKPEATTASTEERPPVTVRMTQE